MKKTLLVLAILSLYGCDNATTTAAKATVTAAVAQLNPAPVTNSVFCKSNEAVADVKNLSDDIIAIEDIEELNLEKYKSNFSPGIELNLIPEHPGNIVYQCLGYAFTTDGRKSLISFIIAESHGQQFVAIKQIAEEMNMVNLMQRQDELMNAAQAEQDAKKKQIVTESVVQPNDTTEDVNDAAEQSVVTGQ